LRGFIGIHGLPLFVILAGASIRLFACNEVSLFNDEWHALREATKDSFGIILRHYLSFEFNQQPLYALLNHFALKILPLCTFSVRFVSMAFGILTLPLLYTVARKHFGSLTAFISVTLLAFNFFHISYSCWARPYALLVFLFVLGLHYSLEVLRNGSKGHRREKLLGISVLACLTHPVAAAYIVMQYLILGIRECGGLRNLRRITFKGKPSIFRWFFIDGLICAAFVLARSKIYTDGIGMECS